METRFIPCHADIILTVHVEGEYVATGSKDNTAKIFKLNEEKIALLGTYKGHSDNVTSVHIARKKKQFFASVSKDMTIKLWKIEEKEEGREINEAMMTVVGHAKEINVVRGKKQKERKKKDISRVVSPNDKLVASGSQDRLIKIWDSRTLREKV